MENTQEPGTPTTPAEPTVPSKTAEEKLAEELAELRKTNVELQEQKKHWREKYERDITSVATKPVPSEDDVFSDEGKALKGSIEALQEKLSSIEKKEARRDAEAQFPFLKDKKEEFDAFLEDEENKRLSIRKAAKLFAAEHGMLDTQSPRKGLEKPTGGGQIAPKSELSPDEIRDLMKNDWKKYEKLIKEGKI